MQNIIITGGAGFIGSHVVRLFVNKYPQSMALDNGRNLVVFRTATGSA